MHQGKAVSTKCNAAVTVCVWGHDNDQSKVVRGCGNATDVIGTADTTKCYKNQNGTVRCMCNTKDCNHGCTIQNCGPIVKSNMTMTKITTIKGQTNGGSMKTAAPKLKSTAKETMVTGEGGGEQSKATGKDTMETGGEGENENNERRNRGDDDGKEDDRDDEQDEDNDDDNENENEGEGDGKNPGENGDGKKPGENGDGKKPGENGDGKKPGENGDGNVENETGEKTLGVKSANQECTAVCKAKASCVTKSIVHVVIGVFVIAVSFLTLNVMAVSAVVF